MKPNCTMVSWFTFPSVSTIDTSKVSQYYHLIHHRMHHTHTTDTPRWYSGGDGFLSRSKSLLPRANSTCSQCVGGLRKNRVRAEGDEDDDDLGDGWNPALLRGRCTKPFANDRLEHLSELLESGNQALKGGYPPETNIAPENGWLEY